MTSGDLTVDLNKRRVVTVILRAEGSGESTGLDTKKVVLVRNYKSYSRIHCTSLLDFQTLPLCSLCIVAHYEGDT